MAVFNEIPISAGFVLAFPCSNSMVASFGGGTITNFTNLIFQQRSNNSYQTDLKTTSFPFGKRSAVMAAVAINWQLGVFRQSEPTISTIT